MPSWKPGSSTEVPEGRVSPAQVPPAQMSDPVSSEGVVAKAIFTLCAMPWIVQATVRTLYWTRRQSLDLAVDQLRAVPRFRWGYLRRPEWLCASVDRVLPVVPLRGFGPCLKRSLLLLDLWGRCELEPQLHLGIRVPGASPAEGHAWVSSAVDPTVATSNQGYPSGFSF